MKYAISTAAIITVLVIAVFAHTGCREQSNQALVRQARITGNENIELKEQIKTCRQEIEKQKGLLLQYQQDSGKARQTAGENSLRLLKMLAKDSEQTDELIAANKRLKAQLKKLQAQPAQKTQ